jgi:hypothetical protein
MTRIASSIAFVALISFALGCADNNRKPATIASAQKKTEARADGYVVIGDDETKAFEQKKSDQKKDGAFVIFGNDDNPKSVTATIKQGKQKTTARAPKPAPEPAKPEEPTFVVSGGFETTKEKAKESAIRAAVEKVHHYLLEQQPPVSKDPTTEMVRKMIITHQGASEADRDIGKVTEQEIEVSGTSEKCYQVELAIKVRPEHVRSLRSDERSREALWILAGIGGLAAVFAIFFKIDSWTKGYLTSWLVLGTVGAAALLGGMWWFAK